MSGSDGPVGDAAEGQAFADEFEFLSLGAWVPWIPALLLFFIGDSISGSLRAAFGNAVQALTLACPAMILVAATFASRMGMKCRARARAYWLLIGLLTLWPALAPFAMSAFLLLQLMWMVVFLVAGAVRPDRPTDSSVSPGVQLAFAVAGVLPPLLVWVSQLPVRFLATVAGIAIVLVVLVPRLWFTRGERPSDRIHAHLGSALLLWFFASSLFVVVRDRLAALPLTLVPLLWIVWTARIALSSRRTT